MKEQETLRELQVLFEPTFQKHLATIVYYCPLCGERMTGRFMKNQYPSIFDLLEYHGHSIEEIRSFFHNLEEIKAGCLQCMTWMMKNKEK